MPPAAPCTDPKVIRPWSVRILRLVNVMAWSTSLGRSLILYTTRAGQLVAYEDDEPVAVWALGVRTRDAIAWCTHRAWYL